MRNYLGLHVGMWTAGEGSGGRGSEGDFVGLAGRLTSSGHLVYGLDASPNSDVVVAVAVMICAQQHGRVSVG